MPIREQRQEIASTMAFSAGNTIPLVNGIPRNLPLTRIMAVLEGRLTISAQTTAGAFFQEAPATLIRKFQISGTKATGGGSDTLINIRGEEAHRLTQFYESYLPVGLGVAAQPGSGGTAFPAGLAATANGSYDFRVYYELPLSYRFASIQDEVASITDPSIYSQPDLSVTFGNGAQNLVDATFVGTTALSAFGSATGTPSVRFYRYNPLASKLPIGRMRVFHSSRRIAIGGIGATFADTKITDIQPGRFIRALMFRQYLENASVTGQMETTGSPGTGGARFGDNSNVGTYRWRIKLNGYEIGRMFNPDLQEDSRQQFDFGTLMPAGYSLWDFASRGFVSGTGLDTRGYAAAGTRLELNGDALSLAAADVLDLCQIEHELVAQ
jgi:hypothetical protein